MTTACAVYDFTLSEAFVPPEYDPEVLCAKLREVAKKFCFQLEESDTGYRHYQGRFSLWKKKRPGELNKLITAQHHILERAHIAPTSTPSSGDTFYVMKLDTRVAGPWTDKDLPVYIPRQYRILSLRPWQQVVFNTCDDFEPRKINCLATPEGNIGKSTVVAYCCLHRNAIRIPAVNDHEKLLASVCDILTAKQERKPCAIFIDLPRSMDKSKLRGIFSAIEEIKNGHCYDMRYHYKDWWFDSPSVWVFMNCWPDTRLMSRDRWKFWEVERDQLVPLAPPEEY